MPRSITMRTQLRGSYLGAIFIALLLWRAVSQVIYVVRPIVAEGCIRLINHHIRTSHAMLLTLFETPISWRISIPELWFAFFVGVAAVMVAGWLYAPEKQSGTGI